ncbi:hypothetical protein C9J85_12195 [Haloferax sp. wsp5]|nr:hypothetical protein C9J85_12195 [Haloferax sp. wsp5]
MLDDKFGSSQGSTVKIYARGNFKEDHALEALAAPNDNPRTVAVWTVVGQAEARDPFLQHVPVSCCSPSQSFPNSICCISALGDICPLSDNDEMTSEVLSWVPPRFVRINMSRTFPKSSSSFSS